MQLNDPRLFSAALRGGFIPSYADSAAFETAKGSAAAIGDFFYNTTDNYFWMFDGSWTWIRAGDAHTVDGQHASDMLASAIASMPKRAWGSIAATGTIHFNTGTISGTSGSYSGDTGFATTPAFLMSMNQDNPGGQHGWDFWYSFTYNTITNLSVNVVGSSGGMNSFNLLWMAVGR